MDFVKGEVYYDTNRNIGDLIRDIPHDKVNVYDWDTMQAVKPSQYCYHKVAEYSLDDDNTLCIAVEVG